MSYIDYSNSGIFERNTKNPKAQQKNTQLKDMYSEFYDYIKKKKKGFDGFGFNGVQLLTCFDSYCEAEKKIMCFGKEAHTKEGNLFDFPHQYQTDAYYKYDYAIAHIDDKDSNIPKSHCPQTQYLKTRKLISGFDSIKSAVERESAILSILNNNLNKTSLGGKYTPCYLKLAKKTNQSLIRDAIVYSEFEYENFLGTIFLHELNILRPTHLVFLSGKGYDNHIVRDFGKEFYNKLKHAISNLKKDNPVSDEIVLTSDEIKQWFKIDDYGTNIKIIYAYHPSGRFTKNEREEYMKRIAEFVK